MNYCEDTEVGKTLPPLTFFKMHFLALACYVPHYLLPEKDKSYQMGETQNCLQGPTLLLHLKVPTYMKRRDGHLKVEET